MTAEELKSKIVIHSERGPHPFTTAVTGSICINYSVIVQNQADRFEPRIMNEVKENIREAIVRIIYDDQRKALYDAVDELMMYSHPGYGDGEKFHQAQRKLFEAARYQQTKTEVAP